MEQILFFPKLIIFKLSLFFVCIFKASINYFIYILSKLISVFLYYFVFTKICLSSGQKIQEFFDSISVIITFPKYSCLYYKTSLNSNTNHSSGCSIELQNKS